MKIADIADKIREMLRMYWVVMYWVVLALIVYWAVSVSIVAIIIPVILYLF